MKKILIIIGSIVLCIAAAMAVAFAINDSNNGDYLDTLVFKSSDASAEYTGDALTSPRWEMTSGTLKEGHIANVSVTGSVTNAGEAKNTLSVKILDEDGKDITDRYNIQLEEGILSVGKRNLEVVTGSIQKEYDGTPLVANSYELISGNLVNGHSIKAVYSGSQINVGTSECSAIIAVFDNNGEDVSQNYNVKCHVGTLTVVKRHLSLKSSTVERVYNGVALSNDNISVVEGSVATDQTMVVDAGAKLTGVGEMINKFTVTISDPAGIDVTENYDISYNYGVLRVFASRLTVYTGSDTKVYDGTDFIVDTYGINSGVLATGEKLVPAFSTVARNVGIYENAATFSVVNSAGIDTTKNYAITVVSGTVEILERSLIIASLDDFKVYDGTPLEKHEVILLEGTSVADGQNLSVVYTGTQTGHGTSKNEFTAVIYDEAGEDVTENYNITCLFGNLSVSQRALTLRSPDKSKVYDGVALGCTVDELTVLGSLAPEHRFEIIFTGEQLSVGECVNSFEIRVYDGNGADVTENYVIESIFGKLTVTPVYLTIKTNSDSKIYDGVDFSCERYEIIFGSVPDGENLNAIFFTVERDVGTYGNPALFTVYGADGTDTTSNYVITVEEGMLEIFERRLIISSLDDSKVYDGTPLERNEIILLEGTTVADGQILSVIYTGSQTDYGVSDNEYTVIIYDEDGIDVTSNYNITSYFGELSVSKRPITVHSTDKSQIYNGQVLTGTFDELEIFGTIADGHAFEVIFTGRQVYVGECDNSFEIRIIDENGVDVTDNYDVDIYFGKLRVSVRYVTVETNSDSKIYDGIRLECNEFEIISGEIPDGETINAIFSSNAKSVGNYSNTAVFSVVNAEGVDTTDNYSITVITGNLEIIKRNIVVSSMSDSKTYDGTPLKKEEVTLLQNTTLADAQTLDIVYTGEQTDCGRSENKFVVVIYDENGYNVTSNYIITPVYGNLTVLKRAVTVSSPDKIKAYDGIALRSEANDLKMLIGSVADGQIAEVVFTAEQLFVGERDNVYEIRIYDGAGIDVTGNYDISKLTGILTVTKRELIVSSPTINVVYDGTEKFCLPDDCTVTGTAAFGDELTIILPERHTSVIIATNTVIISLMRDGVDVSENYEITVSEGDFIINKRTIGIATDTQQKVYDSEVMYFTGTPGWYYTSEAQIVDGHSFGNIVFASSIKNVGNVENVVTMSVYDATGEDVTSNYNIVYEYGLLIISKLKLSIKSGSAEKPYDGTPLTTAQDDYVIVEPGEGRFPVNDRLVVTIVGERLSVGESYNYFDIDVYNEYGESVALINYEIEKFFGSLVVTGDDPTENDPIESDPITVMKVKSTATGKIYLRHMSYGDLVGKGEAKPYSKNLMGDYTFNYLSGTALEESGVNREYVEIENYLSYMYVIPSYPVMGTGDYPLPTNDVINLNAHDGTYSLSYYTYAGYGDDLSDPPAEYSDEELEYREYVYNNYLEIDSETKEYVDGIIKTYGFKKNNSDIIKTVANYIQGSAEYDLTVANALDREDNIVISFLRDYKKGVCRHYAAAATAMYRALGIPARYTVGFVANSLAGEWVEVTDKQAHAWVEVYLDGIGWITVEVTGGGNGTDPMPPTPPTVKKAVTLKPVTEYYLYDGNPHNHTGNVQGWDNYKKKGYTLYVDVDGESSAVGWKTVKITGYRIFDKNNQDVTDEFEVTLQDGQMQIYLYELTVLSKSNSKTYDGQALTCNGYGIIRNTSTEGHNIDVYCTGSITNVGTVSNSFTVSVTDSTGRNVNYMYKITKSYGKLQVYAKALHITVDDARKTFDNTPLVSNSYSISESTRLPVGYYLEVEIVGTQTRVGESSNEIRSVKVYTPDGVDVTTNFSITTKAGTLYVDP